ncbi:MAG TPA: serine protease, partial [Pseudonocardiaceae bacterium]|nr:serine protease [Pseudonocardiaceae bacterium]
MTDETPRPAQPGDPGGYPSPWAPTGQPGSSWQPGQQHSPPTTPIGMPLASDSRPRRGGPVVGAVVLSLIVGLVAGGVGGAVGYELASSGSQATSALDLPAPGAVPIANLPAGSVEQVAQKVTPSVVQLRVHGSQIAAEGSGIVL